MTKVPNPHLSEHTEAATGPREYLVVEFDDKFLSRNAQALLALHLALLPPLVMVVDSAGKSLHCWFACQGQSQQILLAFFGSAVSLGADPRTWGKSQFVRMPGGLRKAETKDQPKRRQVILYFDPSPATQWATLSTLSAMPKESTPVRVAKFILLAGVPYIRVQFSHWEELLAWLNANTSDIDAYRAPVLWIRTEQKPRAANEQEESPTYQLRLDNAGLCDVPDEETNWLLWQDAERKRQAIAKERKFANQKRTLAEQQAIDDRRRYHQQQKHRAG